MMCRSAASWADFRRDAAAWTVACVAVARAAASRFGKTEDALAGVALAAARGEVGGGRFEFPNLAGVAG